MVLMTWESLSSMYYMILGLTIGLLLPIQNKTGYLPDAMNTERRIKPDKYKSQINFSRSQT